MRLLTRGKTLLALRALALLGAVPFSPGFLLSESIPHLGVRRSAEVIEASGDLKTDLFSRITFPRRDDLYRMPTAVELDVWRQVVAAALAGDLATAADLLVIIAPSYKVARYTDTSADDGRVYHLLLEADATPEGLIPTVITGWGTYFFDPAAARELSIEVPHPVFDRFTELEGIDAFLQLRLRSFLLAGTHRCASDNESPCDGRTRSCNVPPGQGDPKPYRVSDVSHGADIKDPTVTNVFEVVHETILQSIPRTVVLQLHGNNMTRCANVHVLLSNTGSDFRAVSGGNMFRLKASLDPALTVRVCSPKPEPGECDLCGTDNLQGRWTNGSIANACQASASSADEEQFIHIEQNQVMRENPANRQRLVEAIANTTFAQEETTLAIPVWRARPR